MSASVADRPDPGASLSDLRQKAWPLSPAPDVSRRGADVAAAYAVADAALARGDTAAMVAALGPLLDHADPDVVMDAAQRIARQQLSAGQTDLALATIAKGLSKGGGSRNLRARLLALQGEVLERRGDPEGAMQSYERASDVR